MNDFQAIFGIAKNTVKKTCVIAPLITKDILANLDIKKMSNGFLYSAAHSEHFTLIRSGMGPAFAGDAVLYLRDTACRNILLYGSCGALDIPNGLEVGNIVCPKTAYSMESFTDTLDGYNEKIKTAGPDKSLEKMLAQSDNAKSATCGTVSSIKLEYENIDLYKKMRIDVLDMECSSVFKAALHTGIKCAALFFVWDIIGKKPYYRDIEEQDLKKIVAAQKISSNIICQTAKTLTAS